MPDNFTYKTDNKNQTGIKPEVINEMIDLAKRFGVHKVILFGSRARGTFQEKSDIDLAVSGGDYAQFRLAVEEETSTLLKFDVVDLDKNASEELRTVIKKEGIVLYEKV